MGWDDGGHESDGAHIVSVVSSLPGRMNDVYNDRTLWETISVCVSLPFLPLDRLLVCMPPKSSSPTVDDDTIVFVDETISQGGRGRQQRPLQPHSSHAGSEQASSSQPRAPVHQPGDMNKRIDAATALMDLANRSDPVNAVPMVTSVGMRAPARQQPAPAQAVNAAPRASQQPRPVAPAQTARVATATPPSARPMNPTNRQQQQHPPNPNGARQTIRPTVLHPQGAAQFPPDAIHSLNRFIDDVSVARHSQQSQQNVDVRPLVTGQRLATINPTRPQPPGQTQQQPANRPVAVVAPARVRVNITDGSLNTDYTPLDRELQLHVRSARMLSTAKLVRWLETDPLGELYRIRLGRILASNPADDRLSILELVMAFSADIHLQYDMNGVFRHYAPIILERWENVMTRLNTPLSKVMFIVQMYSVDQNGVVSRLFPIDTRENWLRSLDIFNQRAHHAFAQWMMIPDGGKALSMRDGRYASMISFLAMSTHRVLRERPGLPVERHPGYQDISAYIDALNRFMATVTETNDGDQALLARAVRLAVDNWLLAIPSGASENRSGIDIFLRAAMNYAASNNNLPALYKLVARCRERYGQVQAFLKLANVCQTRVLANFMCVCAYETGIVLGNELSYSTAILCAAIQGILTTPQFNGHHGNAVCSLIPRLFIRRENGEPYPDAATRQDIDQILQRFYERVPDMPSRLFMMMPTLISPIDLICSALVHRNPTFLRLALMHVLDVLPVYYSTQHAIWRRIAFLLYAVHANQNMENLAQQINQHIDTHPLPDTYKAIGRLVAGESRFQQLLPGGTGFRMSINAPQGVIELGVVPNSSYEQLSAVLNSASNEMQTEPSVTGLEQRFNHMCALVRAFEITFFGTSMRHVLMEVGQLYIPNPDEFYDRYVAGAEAYHAEVAARLEQTRAARRAAEAPPAGQGEGERPAQRPRTDARLLRL